MHICRRLLPGVMLADALCYTSLFLGAMLSANSVASGRGFRHNDKTDVPQ